MTLKKDSKKDSSIEFNKDFENKYNPKEAEQRIREFWEKNKIFKFDKDTKKEVFSIDTPPPTISGRMHIGHAFSYTQTDFIARYKRMKGFEVYYPFGTDDNGLPTEKLVQKEKKVDLRRVSREEAIKITIVYLNEERPHFIQDFKDVGLSCDFDLAYSSINDYSRKISQKSFLDLAKKDLVYRKEGPILWDRVFQTAIAQAELEDKKVKSTLNYIKAKFEHSKDTYLIYATTRPELLHACVGMSIEDEGEYVKLKVKDEYWITGAQTYIEKFKDFDYSVVEKLKGQEIIGEKVIIPLSNLSVEIGHDISVKAEYGTGIVYYCTYGGLDCVEWMARHKDVKPISILDKKGKLNNKAGKYEGLIASTEGRSKIIKDLEEEGHLIKKDNIEHIVNVGERGGAEVEYIISKQWFVNYLDRKEEFFEQAQKLNWNPEFMKHRLENWIKGLNWDWGFSRQRSFGIPIPVWYCSECEKIMYPNENQLPIDPTSTKPKEKCSCGSSEFIAEEDVFDTWYTSASSPFLASNLMKGEKVYDKIYPMNLRPQAHDIINFWLFYTMAKTNLIYNENPWKDIAISGWVLDPQGKKMSKSKGNTIAPQDITAKYSNDGIRFAAASAKLGFDLPFPEKEVNSGVKVANKLYNANKFASMLLKNFTQKDREFQFDELKSIDKWIIAKLQNVIKIAEQGFEKHDYSKGKSEFELYFMRDIADNYLEIVKSRLWNLQSVGEKQWRSASQAIYHVLLNSLKGFAPYMPFITEEIYQIFYKQFEKDESIHKSNYPIYNKEFDNKEIIENGNKFVEIVSAVRKYKSEKNLSMKEEIDNIEITCDKKLKEFITDSIEDLKSVTSSKEITFKNGEFGFKIN